MVLVGLTERFISILEAILVVLGFTRIVEVLGRQYFRGRSTVW